MTFKPDIWYRIEESDLRFLLDIAGEAYIDQMEEGHAQCLGDGCNMHASLNPETKEWVESSHGPECHVTRAQKLKKEILGDDE